MRKIFTLLLLSCISSLVFSQSEILVRMSDAAFKGESTVANYTDCLEALNVSFGVSNPFVPGVGGGVGGAGKASFSDFSFMHNGSQNSPVFNFYTASGTNIKKVDIFFQKMDSKGNPKVMYQVTLENVTVTSVSTSATNDCSNCSFGMESISFSYNKITWHDVVNNITKSWDIAENKAL